MIETSTGDSVPCIRRLLREMLSRTGWALPVAAITALGVAGAGTVVEALLFRGLFDLGQHLHVSVQRLSAIAALLIFLGMLLALDWPATLSLFRLGRVVELGLRTRFLSKVPRLGDRFIRSRSISDLAYRQHSLHILRKLPEAVGYAIYLSVNLFVTAAAILALYPGSAITVVLAVTAACGIPLLFSPAMAERDLRYREKSAALGGCYRDSLLGSCIIQAHSAQRSVRAMHGRQLRQWTAAGLHQQVLYVAADAVQMVPTYACVAALVYQQAALVQNPAGLLLLIYWVMSVPQLGQEFANVVRKFPAMRNTLMRFAELIAGPEEMAGLRSCSPGIRGMQIEFDQVVVSIEGRTVLGGVDLRIDPGEHVAILGMSGAGKSTLVGCLQGWHSVASGRLIIDGVPLKESDLARLRHETAWIDSQVHLFSGTLLDNLFYGNAADRSERLWKLLETTDLDSLLTRNRDGLQDEIGEGGTRLSGGEGQRLRVARAMARPGVRLAILDEPMRGLVRAQRQRLVTAARAQFSRATLLCVTHDASDTLEFDRILVMEKGRIVEQGPPKALHAAVDSRFRALIDAEAAITHDLWSHPKWRKWSLQEDGLHETRSQIPAVEHGCDLIGRRAG